MLKRPIVLFVVVCLAVSLCGCASSQTQAATPVGDDESATVPLSVAVEYTDHAAAYYIAEQEGLFADFGLAIEGTKIYASGVAVAAALTKEGFDVSYMCLVPAIFTYANGGVPIKIIAGTHKNGYGLVVNSGKITSVGDLAADGIRIANGPEGTTTDFLQKILVQQQGLDPAKMKANTVRMNASKQLMALYSGQVDAIFVPEHFATLAASFPGMEMLVRGQDIWPEMQGSVLAVTTDLLNEHPDVVEKLRSVNSEGIVLLNNDTGRTSAIIADCLSIKQDLIRDQIETPDIMTVDGALVAASLSNMTLTEEISTDDVQVVIDKMYELGYIEAAFDASEILAIE